MKTSTTHRHWRRGAGRMLPCQRRFRGHHALGQAEQVAGAWHRLDARHRSGGAPPHGRVCLRCSGGEHRFHKRECKDMLCARLLRTLAQGCVVQTALRVRLRMLPGSGLVKAATRDCSMQWERQRVACHSPPAELAPELGGSGRPCSPAATPDRMYLAKRQIDPRTLSRQNLVVYTAVRSGDGLRKHVDACTVHAAGSPVVRLSELVGGVDHEITPPAGHGPVLRAEHHCRLLLQQ